MDFSKLIMEYKGYHAIVEFDAEDQIFVGVVFGIADSLSFHGTSVEELEKSFIKVLTVILMHVDILGKNQKGGS